MKRSSVSYTLGQPDRSKVSNWSLFWLMAAGQWCLYLMVGVKCYRLKARLADYAGSDPT